MSDKGLHTKGLTVRYGGLVANDSVTIDVDPGTVVGLIGPNGAGKTTFVDAVTGFTASAGEILLDGTRIDALPPHERRTAGLSRTWQSGELFGNLSVAENLLVAARAGGWRTLVRDIFVPRRKVSDDVVSRALEVVGLADVADTLARDLTLGQQKLVGVARALAGGAEVLLLDEPAAGLDSMESRAFAARVRSIADSGPGILLIDHDMSLVLGVCDVVTVLEFGKQIFTGTPAEARTDPTVVAAYLGAPVEASHA
ncbi:ABC transporter ATP-binding protein [Pseudonocardia kujensis]|uniref:ABC transporter ATP-binding protein n=1 Tax=Pseudonocardia kujensis TaxID=1128675 RepID=UPI001E37F257|nr:ABC transporter ATP-binding protein [Pseudonocardia kujensis]MCE0762789.1 ABC transporter ATP-binding protein [Pseudonocardia kujensis]